MNLTLTNNGIEGSHALVEIIIYNQSTLKVLDIQGNGLKNEGIKDILNALIVNKTIESINLTDN